MGQARVIPDMSADTRNMELNGKSIYVHSQQEYNDDWCKLIQLRFDLYMYWQWKKPKYTEKE